MNGHYYHFRVYSLSYGVFTMRVKAATAHDAKTLLRGRYPFLFAVIEIDWE